MRFEWDDVKAAANRRRHGVSFREAASVFTNPLARIFDDEDHSADELRKIMIGHSRVGRLLVISYTVHGEAVRIISARKATRNERKDYEEDIAN
jgi:uncharacterized DUF497 family protein